MILGVCYFFYSPKNGIMTPISTDRLLVICIMPPSEKSFSGEEAFIIMLELSLF